MKASETKSRLEAASLQAGEMSTSLTTKSKQDAGLPDRQGSAVAMIFLRDHTRANWTMEAGA